MHTISPRRPRSPRGSRPASAAPAAVLFVFSLAVAACSGGGGASTPSTGTGAATPGPSGSPGCTAAPAPPAQQEGWTSAPAEPSVFPVVVNSSGSLTCGENRLLFTFLDADNRPVARPDRTASVAIFDLGRDGATPTQRADASFVWGIENERGFYVATVGFAEAGEWGAEFTTAVAGGPAEMIRYRFQVQTSSPVVRVGQPAPASDTATGASVGGDLAQISTDREPDPRFYETSVKAALAAHEPFVLVFATPKFCASAQCGPTLDLVKPLAAEYPDVRFIHVEPYQLTWDGTALQAVQTTTGLVTTDIANEWGLLSEPWVFVVDRNGLVTASYEGIVGTDELDSAIGAVR